MDWWTRPSPGSLRGDGGAQMHTLQSYFKNIEKYNLNCYWYVSQQIIHFQNQKVTYQHF